MKHFFRDFPQWLGAVPDPRQEGKVVYPKETMLWSALLMYITGAGSRNQFDCNLDEDTSSAAGNVRTLSGVWCDDLPTAKATADFLESVGPAPLADLPSSMVKQLIRSRVLESSRLLGAHYLIAIDLTGWMSFPERHCEYCLTQTKDGTTRYYHTVAEAKLVTSCGLALSVATEFVENSDPQARKQDCELAAFPRLLAKIRHRFPQLPICLLLDGIYPSEPMMELCDQYEVEWIASFKEGHLPNAFREFSLLKTHVPENVAEVREDGRYQRIAWMNELRQGKKLFHAFDCLTYNKDMEQQYFAFCTSLPVGRESCQDMANRGGRVRWKIENEGFNVQKNGDMQLEHIYSYNLDAAKAYYILLQVAHILVQLMWQGSLLKAARKRLHSVRNFLRRLGEHLKYKSIPPPEEIEAAARACQIRLNSS